MCLPTVTQARPEHITQRVSLVQAVSLGETHLEARLAHNVTKGNCILRMNISA